MANDCYFIMKVKGPHDNLKEFISIMEGIHSEGLYLKKIYDVYPSEIEEDGDLFITSLSGYCAASVNSSMLDDEDSDYQQCKSSEPKITNIELESERLSLKIDIHSEEVMAGFEEHVIVESGKVLKYEYKDIVSYYDEAKGDYVKQGGFGVI